MKPTIIFVCKTGGFAGSYGMYPGFSDVLKAAKLFSGCKIVCASDAPPTDPSAMPGIHWVNLLDLEAGGILTAPEPMMQSIGVNFASVYRWLAISALMKLGNIHCPVFTPDWDCMIFSDIEKACAPFLTFDFGTSFFENNRIVSPGLVNNREAIDDFCDIVHAKTSWGEHDNDMSLWQAVRDLHPGKYRIANMAAPVENGEFGKCVFDCGMHQIVESCPVKTNAHGVKIIEWNNRKPYFRMTDESLIRAHLIHCWGSYKKKTGQLLEKAT
jgi:hypothetical protein